MKIFINNEGGLVLKTTLDNIDMKNLASKLKRN